MEPHAGLLDWQPWVDSITPHRTGAERMRPPRLRSTFSIDGESRWLVVERGPISVVCNLAGPAARRHPIRAGGAHELLLVSEGPSKQ